MDIKDLKVYDPKSDGITAEKVREISEAIDKMHPRASYFFKDGLTEKVLDSKIAGNGLTLRKFLSGKNGYLAKKGEVCVVFMDGKFHSEYNGSNFPDLDKLEKETNSIPFAFSYSSAIYDACFH